MTKIYLGTQQILASTETQIAPYTNQPLTSVNGRTALGTAPTGTTSIVLYCWYPYTTMQYGRSISYYLGTYQIDSIPSYDSWTSSSLSMDYIILPTDLTEKLVFLKSGSTSQTAFYIALTNTNGTIYISAYNQNPYTSSNTVDNRPLLWSKYTPHICRFILQFIS